MVGLLFGVVGLLLCCLLGPFTFRIEQQALEAFMGSEWAFEVDFRLTLFLGLCYGIGSKSSSLAVGHFSYEE